MKTRLFFLSLIILGYWMYLHDFQSQAMVGLNNLKYSYQRAIDVQTVSLSDNNQK